MKRCFARRWTSVTLLARGPARFATNLSGPLMRDPQVLLAPHIGSFTVECCDRMEMEAVENLLEAPDGRTTS